MVSHWHAIILEGGFDENGNFIHIPFGTLQEMTECFRRRVVNFFLDSELISQDMADNLLRWRHSGFSVDVSILLPGGNSKKRESLAQYLARPPISLKKVSFESFGGKVLFHTSFNEYFKENLKLFDAADFIALLTLHIAPKGVQYLRRYGLGAPGCTPPAAAASLGRPRGPISLMWQHLRLRAGSRSTLILRIHTKAKTYTKMMLLSAQRSAGPHGHGYAPRPIAKVYEGCAPRRIRWSVVAVVHP